MPCLASDRLTDCARRLACSLSIRIANLLLWEPVRSVHRPALLVQSHAHCVVDLASPIHKIAKGTVAKASTEWPVSICGTTGLEP